MQGTASLRKLTISSGRLKSVPGPYQLKGGLYSIKHKKAYHPPNSSALSFHNKS
jgi:hypothetical protein